MSGVRSLRLVAKLALLICLVTVFLSLAACAEGEKGEATSVTPSPGSAIVVVPNVITSASTSIVVYGSGFIPDRTVSIQLVGEWKLTEGGMELDVKDPDIGVGEVNKYCAFSTTIRVSYLVNYLAISPGTYTVRAIGEGCVASAVLVVTESE